MLNSSSYNTKEQSETMVKSSNLKLQNFHQNFAHIKGLVKIDNLKQIGSNKS
jgi:hypothetical protein